MATAPDPRKLQAEQRAEAARSSRYVVTVDGVDHTFRLGDVSARDVKDLREQGLTVRDLLVGIDGEVAELDRLAAVIWMARRQAGDGAATLGEVETALRFDQVISISAVDSPELVEDHPDPPPSGGS